MEVLLVLYFFYIVSYYMDIQYTEPELCEIRMLVGVRCVRKKGTASLVVRTKVRTSEHFTKNTSVFAFYKNIRTHKNMC